MASKDHSALNDHIVDRRTSTGPILLRVVISITLFMALILIGSNRHDIIDFAQPALTSPPIERAIDFLTVATLLASAGLLRAFGFDVYTVPSAREFGMDDFHVYVWGPCSGIEGMALITIFLSIYLWMFRNSLRFPSALVLFPAGIALSWCLNVARISILMFIGARISPELAIDTFHSHAGWLMFTILAAGLTGATSIFGWFRRYEAAVLDRRKTYNETDRKPPLFADANIATIIPFIIFMASAFLLQAFTANPDRYYPFRAVAMVGAVLVVVPYLRKLDWRAAPLPILAGLSIGALWLFTTPPQIVSEQESVFATMTLAGSAVWIIARILGTALLVPIIEEMFFRGYVLRKLDTGSLIMRLVAIIVTSAAFAILHERWLAAFFAGFVFALIFLRRHRLSDAIYAHAGANALIAAYAVLMQDWTVI